MNNYVIKLGVNMFSNMVETCLQTWLELVSKHIANMSTCTLTFCKHGVNINVNMV